MVTYMYAESDDIIYMLVYSDYPTEAVENSDPYVLLDVAKEGYVEGDMNLDISKEEQNELSGNKGIYFEADGDNGYTAVQDYIVDNRLFQIAILRTDRAPTDKEIKDFIGSFKFE